MLTAPLAVLFLLAPPKPDKLPNVAKAVRSVNAMIEKLDYPDDGAREVIGQSKALAGRHKALLRVRELDYEEGVLVIEGTITVKHPDADRYRTQEEREQVAEITEALKRVAEDRRAKLATLAASYEDAQAKQRKNKSANGSRRKLDYNNSVRKAKREFDDKEKKLRKELAALMKDIREREVLRRDACEVIEVRAVFAKPGELDLPAITKAGKLWVEFTIDEYALSTQPEELGGRPQLESLEVSARERPNA